MTKRIVTHSGGFHADDVFGVAALEMLLGEENSTVTRTRDDGEITAGDFVLDVGFVYDPEHNRFDHHQEGGAGFRENGVPYASFGLIWKEYGERIAGSSEVAERIDARFVQAIDAYDNGFPLFSLTHSPAAPFLVQDVISLFEPFWRENKSNEEGFAEAKALAKKILERLILATQKETEIDAVVSQAYAHAPDKQLVIFEDSFVADRILIALSLGKYPEPLLFVRRHEDGFWQAVSVVEPPLYYNNRKLFPETWRGKHDEELAAVTGVPDAFFCHREGFMAVAKSKEGALALAKLALDS